MQPNDDRPQESPWLTQFDPVRRWLSASIVQWLVPCFSSLLMIIKLLSLAIACVLFSIGTACGDGGEDQVGVGLSNDECRLFAAAECPTDDGCFIRPEQPFDEERGCFRNEVTDVCVATLLTVDVVLPSCDD